MRASLARVQAAVVIALALATTSCKHSSDDSAHRTGSSLIFDSASPEAQQALAIPVDFRLTEENFAEWEAAQRNLDALPRSALASGRSSGGNPIDRAVDRLESSPRARTAIERTGLSVRDFVLETIALAQATEATATAKSAATGQIPPGNLNFVEDHRARVLAARGEQRRASEDNSAVTNMAAAGGADIRVSDSSSEQSADSSRSTQESRQNGAPKDTAPRDSVPRVPPKPPPRDTAPETTPSRAP